MSTIALYGGGFKPPTKGHFGVIEKALKENPEIDEFITFVGAKERNGINQSESLLIWDIYSKYLPMKVEFSPSKRGPIGDIASFIKNHPDDKILFVIGAREDNQEDFNDIKSRTTPIVAKYPNVEVKIITSSDPTISGTNARKAVKASKEELAQYLPTQLSDKEVEEVYNLLSPIVTEEITKSQLDSIEGYADKLFAKLGIDIEFTKHFLDRVNDKRNKKPITSPELIGMFKRLHKKHGKPLSKVDDDFDAVVKDFNSNINIPFAINVTPNDIDLVAKTIMRKKDFKTSTPVIALNENATYTKTIDLVQHLAELTQNMLDNGDNIEPLPNIEFINGDSENASNFFGKTAYYDPSTKTIVIYTEGRHPKDIARSYAHEMIHHTQNLEGRLEGIGTTNTNEDDNLQNIEKEAYLNGNIKFRNWTDSLQENKNEVTLETLFEEEDRLMVEVVNPDGERFEYDKSNIKGLYTYKDSRDNLYFARITYSPSSPPKFEFKVGWFENNDISKPKYEPQLPPNTTSIDNLKRRNTVAKIYRDEVLPFLKNNQKLAKQLNINPISNPRYIFSQRLVQKHTPPEYNIDLKDEKIIISLPVDKVSDLQENISNNTYPFKVTDKSYDDTDNSLITVEYEFTTPDNTYRVEFYSGEYSPEAKTFALSFGVDTGEFNTLDTFQMTGEGNARKIFRTILNIIEDFVNKEDVNKIVVDGTSEKRKRIYKTIFSSAPSYISDKIELRELDKPYKHKHGFDDKLGKDPFGLNQFAREIAEGVLNEGVYDSIVSKLSKEVLETWIEQFKQDPNTPSASLDKDYELKDAKGRPLDFLLSANIDFKKTEDGKYIVDGGADEGTDEDEGFITLNFQVDPTDLPKMWSTISMDIRDVLRHEIEHLTQGGYNVRPDKYMEDDQAIRTLIQKYELLPLKNYFLLNKEVDAMLQGMWFKAKKSKTQFKDVIDDYLDKVGLEPEEKEEIKDHWRKRRKALALPMFEYITPAKEKDVDPKELKMGVEVEMEHTKNPAEAKIIALQHLAEDPKYYTKLASLGLEENKPQDGKAAPYGSGYNEVDEAKKKDPKVGTGKKPKGSSRRLYTDEDPTDTVKVKFSTRQDIVDTLNKTSFKNKSHARQSQIINLIHQRVRAAYNRAKDPDVKKRLKTALDYVEERKEASKKKTQRLKKQKLNEFVKSDFNRILFYQDYFTNVAPSTFNIDVIEDNIIISGINDPYPPGFNDVTDTRQTPIDTNLEEGDTIEKYSAKGKATGKLKQGTVRKRLNIPKGEKIPMYKINKELARLKKMDKDPDKKGAQLGDKNQKYYKALQLAKTLKTTTNVKE
jgi:hypothetical protein